MLTESDMSDMLTESKSNHITTSMSCNHLFSKGTIKNRKYTHGAKTSN